MGFFKDLLGVDKAVDVVGDFAKSGMSIIDKAWHTDEEKAQNTQTLIDKWMKLQEIVATQSSPTAVSRRKVAWGVMSLIWLMVVQCLLYVAWGDLVIDPNTGIATLTNGARIDMIIKVAIAFQLGWAFCTVIVFYFGPHLIAKLTGKPISGGDS